jgi:hypothetical protein
MRQLTNETLITAKVHDLVHSMAADFRGHGRIFAVNENGFWVSFERPARTLRWYEWDYAGKAMDAKILEVYTAEAQPEDARARTYDIALCIGHAVLYACEGDGSLDDELLDERDVERFRRFALDSSPLANSRSARLFNAIADGIQSYIARA